MGCGQSEWILAVTLLERLASVQDIHTRAIFSRLLTTAIPVIVSTLSVLDFLPYPLELFFLITPGVEGEDVAFATLFCWPLDGPGAVSLQLVESSVFPDENELHSLDCCCRSLCTPCTASLSTLYKSGHYITMILSTALHEIPPPDFIRERAALTRLCCRSLCTPCKASLSTLYKSGHYTTMILGTALHEITASRLNQRTSCTHSTAAVGLSVHPVKPASQLFIKVATIPL
ncbi:hypothetical protein J6590_091570 [Homalodisca vitripennis]|nr:hypothetical protein J6590_091570 [Homalodisca vitripennis]